MAIANIAIIIVIVVIVGIVATRIKYQMVKIKRIIYIIYK